MTWTRYMICSRDSGEDKGGDYTRVMGDSLQEKHQEVLLLKHLKDQ